MYQTESVHGVTTQNLCLDLNHSYNRILLIIIWKKYPGLPLQSRIMKGFTGIFAVKFVTFLCQESCTVYQAIIEVATDLPIFYHLIP